MRALAGVGVCAPVVTMITAIGALIGFGGGPLMSIRMGRRDMDGARQIITNSFYLLLALSVLATVPLLIFKRQILFTFGCSELLWDYAQAYFTTYVSGTVFALLSYGLNQITMSQGFSGTAMRSVMLGAAVNIALDRCSFLRWTWVCAEPLLRPCCRRRARRRTSCVF